LITHSNPWYPDFPFEIVTQSLDKIARLRIIQILPLAISKMQAEQKKKKKGSATMNVQG